jgi:hypothetical protein
VRFGDARTGLQQRFEAPGERPWFQPDWSHGALRLTPAGAGFSADDLAWSELVSATATLLIELRTNITLLGRILLLLVILGGTIHPVFLL